MAIKEIVPYGFDLSKKPNVLALTVIPLEVTLIRTSQSYFNQAIFRLVMIALPPPHPLLEDKPRQQEPCLDL